MTNLAEEQSQWTLTYDYGGGQLTWNTEIPLWEATAMLEGVFRGIDVAGADIPTYISRNYEQRVTVRCGEMTYYEGMLGSLARIALDELGDEELSVVSPNSQDSGFPIKYQASFRVRRRE